MNNSGQFFLILDFGECSKMPNDVLYKSCGRLRVSYLDLYFILLILIALVNTNVKHRINDKRVIKRSKDTVKRSKDNDYLRKYD